MRNTISELLDDQELMNVQFEAFLSPVSSAEDKQFRAALYDCLGNNTTMGRFLRIYRDLWNTTSGKQADVPDAVREFFRASHGRIGTFVERLKEMGCQGLRRYLGIPYDGEEADKMQEKIGVDPSIAGALEDDIVVKLGREWVKFRGPPESRSTAYDNARWNLLPDQVFLAWLATHGREIIEEHKALQDAQKPVRWLSI